MFFSGWLDWKSEAGLYLFTKNERMFSWFIKTLRHFCILAHLRSSRMRFELFIWMVFVCLPRKAL